MKTLLAVGPVEFLNPQPEDEVHGACEQPETHGNDDDESPRGNPRPVPGRRKAESHEPGGYDGAWAEKRDGVQMEVVAPPPSRVGQHRGQVLGTHRPKQGDTRRRQRCPGEAEAELMVLARSAHASSRTPCCNRGFPQ